MQPTLYRCSWACTLYVSLVLTLNTFYSWGWLHHSLLFVWPFCCAQTQLWLERITNGDFMTKTQTYPSEPQYWTSSSKAAWTLPTHACKFCHHVHKLKYCTQTYTPSLRIQMTLLSFWWWGTHNKLTCLIISTCIFKERYRTSHHMYNLSWQLTSCTSLFKDKSCSIFCCLIV